MGREPGSRESLARARCVMHCYECGRFCAYDDDQATYFGDATDLEPPDPLLYCKRCAVRCEEEEVLGDRVVNCFLIKPRWQRRAAARLGYVEIHPKGAAWSIWHDSTQPLPAGYERS